MKGLSYIKSKTALCLDTNILLNLFEPGTHSIATFNKFLTAFYSRKCDLILTDQVQSEWVRHVKSTQEKVLKKSEEDLKTHEELLKYIDSDSEKEEMQNTLNKIKKMEKRKYLYSYGKRAEKIDEIIKNESFTTIVQRTPNAEKLIVEKSISKEAPFFKNERSDSTNKVKNEAADASIFFTLYDYIKNGSLDFETVYFVTDNKKDFSNISNPSQIHENLKLYADEVNMIFSNNIKDVLSKITEEEYIFFDSEETIKNFLHDKFFEICSECKEEVHINSDSFKHSHDGRGYNTTFWLKCRNCGHCWDTGDSVVDI
ncbi:PIN-like domain-containing protein [Peribacillus frigoritolerans]|uniref:PIN-like domain-containing protein n=1 Tax=Peribacillus frigoritolerans TaxID=450367 RepID=UPI00203BED54|nr:PIN-like domain-containing protein [Peribacillus frigoritolerans]MCM3169437.1 PIN-like domain-containing protein [Peribacillus frigoritolerans]